MTAGGPEAGPVRVLQLTKGLGPGGVERLLLTFAGLADPARVELQVAYLLPWKDHLVPSIEAAGVRTHCLHGARAASVAWLSRLRRLVRQERIEVVHVHSPRVAAQARLVLRAMRQPPVLVGTEHNVWSSHRAPTRWANRVTHGLERATIAVSEPARTSMPAALRPRTEVVLHGADVQGIAARRSERDASRKELGLADDELVIVNVANLRATKDHRTLLAAASLVRDAIPGVRFLSVGQGPMADELAHRRDELGLGGAFEFLGFQADPVRVLVAADVFCLSSRYEGLPIASIEAMAAGLPAVVTAVGGMPDVVRDGVEGRLVPPGDPDALASALVDMADPAVRARCGAAAASRAGDFGAGAAVEHQQTLYERLTGRAS